MIIRGIPIVRVRVCVQRTVHPSPIGAVREGRDLRLLLSDCSLTLTTSRRCNPIPEIVISIYSTEKLYENPYRAKDAVERANLLLRRSPSLTPFLVLAHSSPDDLGICILAIVFVVQRMYCQHRLILPERNIVVDNVDPAVWTWLHLLRGCGRRTRNVGH